MTAPRLIRAGLDEERSCAQCSGAIVSGEFVAICPECGAPHHEPCWRSGQGCSSQACGPRFQVASSRSGQVLRITADELAETAPHRVQHAFPSVPPGAVVRLDAPGTGDEGIRRRGEQTPRNRIAAAALVTAIAGIPLVGVVTGLLAVLIAFVALVHHRSGQTGLWMAGAGALLGIGDFVGWTILLSHWTAGP